MFGHDVRRGLHHRVIKDAIAEIGKDAQRTLARAESADANLLDSDCEVRAIADGSRQTIRNKQLTSSRDELGADTVPASHSVHSDNFLRLPCTGRRVDSSARRQTVSRCGKEPHTLPALGE